jgi:Neurotransmitter-gated ion-channel ligand binding domain
MKLGMRSGWLIAMALVVPFVRCTLMAVADPIAGSETDPPRKGSSEPSLLAPPKAAGAAVVRPRFVLHNINAINDASATFEFSGVLTLTWHDPRQAFDPAIAGVHEKVFQGNYQVDELTTGWSPQVVLVNESGLYQKSGVVLRIRPDGTSTLSQTLNAAAKSEVNMRRFPFDGHRLGRLRRPGLRQGRGIAAGGIGPGRFPGWPCSGASLDRHGDQ